MSEFGRRGCSLKIILLPIVEIDQMILAGIVRIFVVRICINVRRYFNAGSFKRFTGSAIEADEANSPGRFSVHDLRSC